MKTDKELIILGLKSQNTKLMQSGRDLVRNLYEVGNPFDYQFFIKELTSNLLEYQENEERLRQLDPSYDEIPF